MDYKIMLIEDDQAIADLLSNHINKYGYDCYVASDFGHILDEYVELDPHLILLDINLPKYDGYYWCRKIRKLSKLPIILISARSNESDQVLGIESGADDYITKPFYYDVVIAKIKSQLRRAYGDYADKKTSQALTIGNTTLNHDKFVISTASQEKELTVTEYKLCHVLFNNYNEVVSRKDLFAAIWDDQNFVEENTLSVNIKRVRTLLNDIQSDLEILTKRGIGYQLVKKDEVK